MVACTPCRARSFVVDPVEVRWCWTNPEPWCNINKSLEQRSPGSKESGRSEKGSHAMRIPVLLAFGHFGRHGGALVLVLLIVALTALAIVLFSSDRDDKKDKGSGLPPKIEK